MVLGKDVVTPLAICALLLSSVASDTVTVQISGAASSGDDMLCAIGDLHGDEMHALRALKLCGAVDETGAWIGGTMTVVQVGDVLDRGNASVPLLERLWSLRKEAAAAGGELVLLIGNHELLNLQGRIHYVEKAELLSFGGAAEWRGAFNPRDGHYGTRIAAQDGFAVRGHGGCRTLFMHAGLRANTARQYGSLDALNAALREQLIENRGELLDVHNGPLWFRGYARPRKVSCPGVRNHCSRQGSVNRPLGWAARPIVRRGIDAGACGWPARLLADCLHV